MLELPEGLEICPSPLILIAEDRDSSGWRLNRAARRIGDERGWHDADWSALAARIGASEQSIDTDRGLRWRRTTCCGGRIAWLEPLPRLPIERRAPVPAAPDGPAPDPAVRARSLFLARISHELRTPLNAVLGYAQMMEKDVRAPLPRQQRERLALIEEAGEHMLALIDDTLDLASIETGTLRVAIEDVDLAVAAEQARRWVATQAERAGVHVELGPVDVDVRADPRRLSQVLVNLLSNAIKYNSRGGQVTLAARREGVDRVLIEVADDGRGMDENQLEQLFKPFERMGADREGIEGIGIGLSLAAHLIGRMQGTISAESVVGVGSTFRIVLPSSERQAAPGVPAISPSIGVPAAAAYDRAGVEGANRSAGSAGPVAESAPLDLLCVDDDPVNQLLVRELCALRPGTRLHTAADGMSAVVIARRTRPALVFLDLQLPDFDGFDVLRKLRADPFLRDTVVVAMSASLSPRIVEQARTAGFADCWEKPFEAGRFLAGLDRCLQVRESVLRPAGVTSAS